MSDETVLRLLDPARESRAIALHAHYLDASRTLGWNRTAAVAAWTALAEDLRDAGRASADHLPILLAAIGRSIDTWKPAEAARLDASTWDRLARIEHRRWMADRIDHGWRHAPTRDDAARRHPCLVPWERLGEMERSKDLEAIRVLLSLDASGTDAGGTGTDTGGEPAPT